MELALATARLNIDPREVLRSEPLEGRTAYRLKATVEWLHL